MKQFYKSLRGVTLCTAVTLMFSLASFTSKGAGLSGTYTIDPGSSSSSTNFTSISSAVSSLSSNGVSGAVIFKIYDGTYTTQISLGSISGTSASNTVTFESNSGDSSAVIIKYASSSSSSGNYVVQMDGADYITFNQLTFQRTGTSTYGRVIYFSGNGSDYNTFSNCAITGISSSSTSNYAAILCNDGANGNPDNENAFTNNSFTNGSMVDWEGNSSSGSRNHGTSFTYNNFQGQYYTFTIEYQDRFNFSHNTVGKLGYTYAYGIWVYQTDSAFEMSYNNVTSGGYIGLFLYYAYNYGTDKSLIHHNTFSCSSPTYYSYMIYGYYATNINFYNNKVVETGSYAYYGLLLYYLEDCNFYNNMVSLSGSNAQAAGYNYGCSNTNFYYNSFLLDQGGNSYQYCYAFENDGGSNNTSEFLNNNFVNTAEGYAYYVGDASYVGNSDFNNIYSNTSSNYIASWYYTDYATLGDLQSGSGYDGSSVSADPGYASTSDLHASSPSIDSKGVYNSSYLTDYDGQTRNTSTPDIGADEFTVSAIDIGVKTFDAPVSYCSGTQDIYITIKNYGTSTITSATIKWTVNSVSQTNKSWTGSLASGASSSSFKIGSYSFVANTPTTLVIWTANPNGTTDGQTSNDTLTTLKNSSLSGTKIIDGAGSGDYTTLTAAVADLTSRGVCGAVKFRIKDGTYAGGVTLGTIAGASASNTITFESYSLDSTKVSIQSSSAIFTFSGTDYVTLNKLTLKQTGASSVLEISGGSDHNTIKNSKLIGYKYNGYSGVNVINSSGDFDNYNTFDNNIIKYGTAAFYYQGTGYSTDYERGTVITNNQIDSCQYMYFYFTFQGDFSITGNTCTNIGTGYPYCYGIYIYNYNYYGLSTGASRINKNRIEMPNGGYYGILMYYMSGGATSAAARGQVSNNFISIKPGSSGTPYGIYMYGNDSQDVDYNNINIYGATSTGSACIYSSSYYSHDNKLNNNCLKNSAGGYAMYHGYTYYYSSINYNNLYTSGTNLSYMNGSSYTTLSGHQSTGYDVNSISANPNYTSNTDLHVQSSALNNVGTPISTITTDIDGTTRSASTPDIGADEFTPLPYDAAIASIDSPMSFCSGTKNVYATISNVGTTTITSLKIDWKLNSTAQTQYSWTGSLASGATVSVKIGSASLSANTPYTFKVWSSLPNGGTDGNHANDTLSVTRTSSLSGTVTIGGTTPTYATINDAVNALVTNGVCGPVILNMRDGTYNEQVSVPAIPGASAINTITFQSQSNDSTKVHISYPANSSNYTNNFTWQFKGCRFVTLKQVTINRFGSSSDYYGRQIQIDNSASKNTIRGCIIRGNANYPYNMGIYDYSYYQTDTANTFLYNKISQNYYGYYFYGYTGTSTYVGGQNITGNTFDSIGYYAMMLYYCDHPKIIGNTIKNISTSGYGIYMYYCPNTSSDYAMQIRGNKIIMSNGGYGISDQYAYYAGYSSNKMLIANNMIIMTNGGYGYYGYYSQNRQFYFNSFSTTGGSNSCMYTYWYTSPYSEIKNNIFSNTSGSSYCLELPTTGMLASSSSLNYNDYYTTGTYLTYINYSAYSAFSSHQSAGFDANGKNVNPSYLDPTNNLHTSLSALNNVGTPISAVTTDYDGQTRNASTPDIGCDEFTPVALDAGVYAITNPGAVYCSGTTNITVTLKNFGVNTLTSATIKWNVNGGSLTSYSWTGSLASGASATNINVGSYAFTSGSYTVKAYSTLPNGSTDGNNLNDTISLGPLTQGLSGTYTVGSGGDYATPSDAVSALTTNGICGAVTFRIYDGTYSGSQYLFTSIAGASATNTVTITSYSGDSSKVTLLYAASSSYSPSTNYLIGLNGADYITISKVTLSRTGTSSGYYGNVIDIRGGAHNNQIRNCRIIGNKNYPYAQLINSQQDLDTNNLYYNNRIRQGGYGFYFYQSGYEGGTRIENNDIDSIQYYGIYMQNPDHFKIKNNKVRITTSGYAGIYTYYGQNSTSQYATEVSGNFIQMPNGGYAWLDYYSAFASSNTKLWLIANNMFYQGGSTTGYSTYLSYYPSYHSFYFNTFVNNVSGNSDYSFYLYHYTSNNNNMVDNVFANTAGGPAAYTYYMSSCDYNDYYVTGGSFGDIDGTSCSSLADWQSAGGLDGNSLDVNPGIVSLTGTIDIHTKAAAINNLGTPITGITKDFDGETRNASTPDIGANEFTPPAVDAGIASIDDPAGVYCGTTTVKATLKNYGLNTLTTDSIYWSVNSTAQTPILWTGSLVSGASVQVSLGSYGFTSGSYTVDVWSSNPNNVGVDGNPANDLLSITANKGLQGTYTVGSGGDYSTLTAAISDLNNSGVCGAVEFQLYDGTYTGHFQIAGISGTSASNRVRFTSYSGDKTKVIITSASSGSSSLDYTVELNGASFITFDKVTIRRTGTNYYGTNFSIVGGSSYDSIANCNLNAPFNQSGSQYYYYPHYNISSPNGDDEYNTFYNNNIDGGTYAFYFMGSGSSNKEVGNVIMNNTVTRTNGEGNFFYYQDGAIISGNSFENVSDLSYGYDAYGAYFYYCDDILFDANTIDIAGTYINYALYTAACNTNSTGWKITNNKIVSEGQSSGYYNYGLYLGDFHGSSSQQAIIANNMITLSGTAPYQNYGIFVDYGNDYNGIYYNNVYLPDASSQYDVALYYYVYYNNGGNNIMNNVFSCTYGSAAFVYDGGSGLLDTLDYNDYFTNGTYFGDYDYSTYSDLSSWQSGSSRDANSVSADPSFVSNTDLHSPSVSLNGVGIDRSGYGITTDFDGETRNSSTPDIGADEYTPAADDAGITALVNPAPGSCAGTYTVKFLVKNFGLSTLTSNTINCTINNVAQNAINWTGSVNSGDTVTEWNSAYTYTFSANTLYTIKAWTLDPNGNSDGDNSNDTLLIDFRTGMNGTYTIGSSGDYTTFTDAVDDLNLRGVCGAVTFNVANGSYTSQQISLGNIAGASASNTITFQSASGDSSLVTLSHPSGSGGNYTVELNGAQYVTFNKMTLTRTGSNYYGTVLNIHGGASNNTFSHCRITTYTYSDYLIYSGGDDDTANVFHNNKLTGSYYGIYLQGSSSEGGTVFSNNIVSGQYYYCFYLYYQDHLKFMNNTTSAQTYSYYYPQVMLYYCVNNAGDNDMRITGNRFNTVNGYAIQDYYSYFTTNNAKCLIANNFFNVSGTGSYSYGYGYYGYYSNNRNVYHNTFNITCTYSGSRGIYTQYCYDNNYMNNVISATGGGLPVQSYYDYYMTSDYNDLYVASGSYVASYNGSSYGLSGYQSASGFETNSIGGVGTSSHCNPVFTSTTDLHINNCFLKNRGTNLSDMPTDIDGESRDATPDLGADEWAISPNVWTGAVSTDWFDILNWCSSDVPNSTTNVTISPVNLIVFSGSNYPEVASSTAECNNLTIDSLASLDVDGGAQIDVYGNYNYNNYATVSQNGNFNLAGSGSQSFKGGNFYDLSVTGTGIKTLTTTVYVDNSLDISSTHAQIYTGGDSIILDSAATLTENDTNMVIGQIMMIGKYIPVSTTFDFGGIGVEVTSSSSQPMGHTTGIRYTGPGAARTGQTGAKGIDRYYDVIPEFNTNLNADATFHYNDMASELNGISESDLTLFYSTDGVDWTVVPGATLNTSTDDVSASGLAHFSLWTVGDNINQLPVEMTSFTARMLDTKTVTIDWTTASELNNDHFEVERSLDGKNFTKIADVAGHGTTSDENLYNNIDNNVDLLHATVLYYRLKQVDFNGHFNLSDIRIVSVNEAINSGAKVWYSNAEERMNIILHSNTNETVSIKLVDMQGKVITHSTVNSVNGVNRFSLNTGGISKGMYNVVITNNSGIITNRVMKY